MEYNGIEWNGFDDLEQGEYVLFCHCVRPSTKSKLTFPLPISIHENDKKGIADGSLIDYVGEEFNWQFIPVGVTAIPVEQLEQ